jgi:hypothetical protein
MLKANGETIEILHPEGTGALYDSVTMDPVVPIYEEVDGTAFDVLYVRVRTDAHETTEQALDRAERIADALNAANGSQSRYNSKRAFRAGGAQ